MKTSLSQLRQFVLARYFVGILITGAMLIAFSNSSFALWPAGIYRFDAIKGTVLDKETRKPVEGVVVVGHWGLERQLIMGSSYTGPLVVKETVTDKDGRFKIPASVATDVHKRGHFNAEMYPEIAFFKSGFEFTVYRHSGKYPISRVPEPYNTLNEDEYLMPRLPQDRAERVQVLRVLSTNFSLIQSSDCLALDTLAPTLLSAIRAEHQRLLALDEILADRFQSEIRLQPIESCLKHLGNKGKSK